jgi:hypothetical protein
MNELIEESGVDFSELEKAGLRMEGKSKAGCSCLDEAAFRDTIQAHAGRRTNRWGFEDRDGRGGEGQTFDEARAAAFGRKGA